MENYDMESGGVGGPISRERKRHVVSVSLNAEQFEAMSRWGEARGMGISKAAKEAILNVVSLTRWDATGTSKDGEATLLNITTGD